MLLVPIRTDPKGSLRAGKSLNRTRILPAPPSTIGLTSVINGAAQDRLIPVDIAAPKPSLLTNCLRLTRCKSVSKRYKVSFIPLDVHRESRLIRLHADT